ADPLALLVQRAPDRLLLAAPHLRVVVPDGPQARGWKADQRRADAYRFHPLRAAVDADGVPSPVHGPRDLDGDEDGAPGDDVRCLLPERDHGVLGGIGARDRRAAPRRRAADRLVLQAAVE